MLKQESRQNYDLTRTNQTELCFKAVSKISFTDKDLRLGYPSNKDICWTSASIPKSNAGPMRIWLWSWGASYQWAEGKLGEHGKEQWKLAGVFWNLLFAEVERHEKGQRNRKLEMVWQKANIGETDRKKKLWKKFIDSTKIYSSPWWEPLWHERHTKSNVLNLVPC